MQLFLTIISIWFLFTMPTTAASLSALCNANSFIKDCNTNHIVFLKYKAVKGTATLKYKIDPGPIGEISADEAFNDAVEMLSRWQEVSSLNFVAKDGGKISKDVTASNYKNYIDTRFPLGYSPLVWDADGSITEELSGDGSRNSILAFGGPAFFTVTNGDVTGIKESYSFFNGYFFNGDNTGESSEFIRNEFLTTILHEVGHMFGLDHTQGGDLEGYLDKTGDERDDVPIMFPIIANNGAELQQDDIAIVKDTYPQGDEKQNYGRIEGSLTDGGIGVRGANVVAFKVDDSNPRKRAVACPSDVDGHRTGNFVLPTLIPGEYIVFAEPIFHVFTGGSSVGSYGAIDPSKFTTGFYNGDTEPIIESSDLSTGIAQAKRITVSAGTTQTIKFKINTNNGNNIEPSFTASGGAFNKPQLLRLGKNKKAQIVLNNLNKSSKRLLVFSTEYPDLVRFSPNDTANVYRKEKIIEVVLAPYEDFLEQFPEIQNGGTVDIPVTMTDISTRYINDSETITVF